MRSITKEFPGVKALDNVNLQVERGEIHALVGENGAGKSTLMNVLSGTYPYGTYTGDIIYNGETCQFHTLRDSEEKGIVIIHQELALIPELSIGENMFLGNERKGRFGINWDKTYHEARPPPSPSSRCRGSRIRTAECPGSAPGFRRCGRR